MAWLSGLHPGYSVAYLLQGPQGVDTLPIRNYRPPKTPANTAISGELTSNTSSPDVYN